MKLSLMTAATMMLAACSSPSEHPPPAQDCDAASCVGVQHDAGVDAADASDGGSDE